MTAPHTERVDAIDFHLTSRAWDFAIERAADIDVNWQRRLAANAHLYNGQVLLMRDVARREVDGNATLSGVCFAVEYKAFLAWHDFRDPGEAKNLFAMAALRAADGGYLLGEMAPWTANAGQIYFPCGTPDPEDLVDDRLDLEGSAMRELAEETGLAPQDVTPTPGWTIVFDGVIIACIKDLRSELSAAELIARTNTFFANEKQPELTRLVPVFGPDDISAQMPPFMQAYLRHAFGAAQGW